LSRRADATPQASALIEGLRDIGYSLETAISDVIDNSITARATIVRIVTESAGLDPFIAIIDNGVGMDEPELVAAMRPGSRNPLHNRESNDLGRFGLGLKSASFSQCRRLTVVSRKNGQVSAAIWDLDDVAASNDWSVELPDGHADIPCIEQLPESGTLVVWQKLDRLAGDSPPRSAVAASNIDRRIAETVYHIRLVFHRFMERSPPLAITLNGTRLKPIDPFCKSHEALRVADPEETIKLPKGTVTVQSITLPHHRALSARDWDELGGPDGHLKTQGFYLYRGDRLILYGTWFGLARQSELTKLSRVRIDIPNSMDADWKIDVKKSSAQLPPVIRDRLKNVLERIQAGSTRTYRAKGQKLVDEKRVPMWTRSKIGDSIAYTPNYEHPVIRDYASKLPEDLVRGFLNCVSFIGASLPIDTLHADMAGMAEKIAPRELEEDTLLQAVTATIIAMDAAGKARKDSIAMLRDVEPFRSSWSKTLAIIECIPETGDSSFES